MGEFVPTKMEFLAKKVAFLLQESGETYSSLNHHKQGIGEIYKFQEEMGLLPELAEKQKKSDVQSGILRGSGNQAYKEKEFVEARHIYTKAICCAEPEGQPIAMAYANRSAVNFELHAYNDAVNDINHALATGKYPNNLLHRLFERRGKCYVALSQFQKAMGDLKKSISLVIEGDLDQEKTNLLKSRSDLLAQHFGKQDVPQPSLQPPKLTHNSSTEIPCASAAVEVKHSDKFGRHVVAAADISPGDVLAVEKPIVSVLYTKMYEQLTYCDHCMIRCFSSVPCHSCSNVVFCSKQCREKSWASYHSIECDLLPTIISYGCPASLLMAIRLLLKSTKCGKDLQELVGEYLTQSDDTREKHKIDKSKASVTDVFVKNIKFSDEYVSIHELITHEEDLGNEISLLNAIMTSCLIHIVKEATRFFDSSDGFIVSTDVFNPVSNLGLNHVVSAELVYRYITAILFNAYGVGETHLVPFESSFEAQDVLIGSAVYGFNSLLNHSCDASGAHYCHNGDTRVLFAFKPIKKGQQIFIGYGYHYAYNNLDARQTGLKNYLFTCECPACVNNWPLIDDMPAEAPTLFTRSESAYRAIRDTYPELAVIISTAENGSISEEQFQALIRFLIEYHKHVKLPWGPYFCTQKAIYDYMMSKGNLYLRSELRAQK